MGKIFSLIQTLLSITFWKEYPYRKRMQSFIRITNKTVKQQELDPTSIPVIIISYNRLADLKKLVDFLIERNHQNIVIVDNVSTYPPLLEYYDSIKDRVTIKIMDQNYGHLVFWKNQELYNEYSKGYYIVTDSDIIPNDNLPQDYLNILIKLLSKYRDVTKVGFALRLDDIPDFPAKEGYINWEKRFWVDEIDKDIYRADVDTTFALYAPKYKLYFPTFYKAIRIAGNFAAQHGSFYIDTNNLNEEQSFYIKVASEKVSSWARVVNIINKP